MGWGAEYRCEATTAEGFVQQLAVSYLKNRYWFYVPGEVPEGKDPRAVDEKLVAKYEIGISKWANARRKKRGLAKVQYLRFGRTFLILATAGEHRFFAEEAGSILDARERAIPFRGYSVGYKDGHPHVRIGTARYEALKAEFVDAALRLSAEELAARFRSLPFEPYGPVKHQLKKLLWKVNEPRRRAGLPKVPFECLRLKRQSVRPFDTPDDEMVTARVPEAARAEWPAELLA